MPIKNPEKRKAYYRDYYKSHRIKWSEYNKIYSQTPSGKTSACSRSRRARVNFPEKEHARKVVSNALRGISPKIKKDCCEVCGSLLVEAHHINYDKPLEIKWLCKFHHREVHYGCDTEYVYPNP